MLLSEYDFKSTFPSEGFLDVTETAENFNTKEFDEYVNNNLIDELGKMHIRYIYDAKDGSYRHIVFTTDLKNIYLVVVIDLITKKIFGHHVLDLNKEYGLSEKEQEY